MPRGTWLADFEPKHYGNFFPWSKYLAIFRAAECSLSALWSGGTSKLLEANRRRKFGFAEFGADISILVEAQDKYIVILN